MSQLTYPNTEYKKNNFLNAVSSSSSKSSSSSFFRSSENIIIPIGEYGDGCSLMDENFPLAATNINIENIVYKSNLFEKSFYSASSKSIIIKDSINICDESFLLEKEDNHYYLSHPKWSLVGMGQNLYEAEIDLLKEAKELLKDMRELPTESLSKEALNLLDYLFSIV
ncbi:MAG: hypothetical protein AUJ54_11530 [Ignavibacteria bacterium CG1_02_37_35]|nr:MAG: hypothetical protein AUJ54_11530 [Ignavibacteria bacterium CG1_02_37_35]PJC60484.1 MAG: hypothetical protein CO025_03050 [Ignavibacteria bacterium CG_4_9_14_0_2_um_filter_37_13]